MMDSEPVVTVSTVTAATAAVLALVVAFGLPLSTTQQSAVLGVAAVVAPLVVMAVRRWVWSPESHRAALLAARRGPVVTSRSPAPEVGERQPR